MTGYAPRRASMPAGKLWMVIDDQARPIEDMHRAPVERDRIGRYAARLMVDGRWWRTSQDDDPTLPLVDNQTAMLCTSAEGKSHVAVAHARAYRAGKGRQEIISWGRYWLPRVIFRVELQDPDCKAQIDALFAEFAPEEAA